MAVALLALGPVGAARSAVERVATNRVAFSDARGENPSGIDISRVVVSSTDDEQVLFRVEIPTNAAFTTDMRIEIWIDSDLDRRTGHERVDHFVLADDEVTPLYGCSNPPACDVFAPQSRAAFGFSYRNGATFRLRARDLGNTKRFRFVVAAYDNVVTNDLAGADLDFAPARNDWWTFDTRTLVANAFSAIPRRPQAGRPFTLLLAAVRTDTGAAVTAGTVSCSLHLGGRTIEPRSRGFAGRRAVCAFDVPRDVREQRYHAAITVRAGTNGVSRSLSGRIG